MDDWRSLLLAFDGRIGRGRWWLGSAIVLAVAVVNASINRAAMPDDGITTIGPGLIQIATFALGIALIWPAVAVSVKRWHDRGKSGWWMLIVLIPVIGSVWAIVELGFLPGDEAPNEYGVLPSSNDVNR